MLKWEKEKSPNIQLMSFVNNEHYVEEKHITNGIITQDTEYLRKLYQELSMGRKM